jgi:RNA 3'-terminal phosphate cyclase (ATP)
MSSGGRIELDGSFGEGGGQILRTSLTLSLVTGRPFHLRNVRARRPKPGLHPQHLMCVRAAARIGGATVRGDRLGSTDLVFEPGDVVAGEYHFSIGTAGATGLVLQTLYLPLALRGDAPSHVRIEGGTHVTASPCFHFLDTTWRAYMALLGMEVRLSMSRPGFYPRGGGQVEAWIQPSRRLRGLELLERGPVARVSGFSAVGRLPGHIAERQARRARQRLEETGLEADVHEEAWQNGPGTVLGLIVETAPVPALFFGLGERGKPAERVADEAADQALAYLAAAPAVVDPHSADQIVLPLAVAAGPSAYSVSEVTRHLCTNIEVIRRFVDREIVCDGDEGQPGTVRTA